MDMKRSVVLETDGVRGHDYKLMAKDFEMQQQLKPSKERAVFHGILSFYPGENPDDEKMVLIAKEYLEKIGMINTQYSITKHIDKKHLHLHVIANMVNNLGKVIKDNWLGLRAKKISQQLTLKHELKLALKKELKLTQLESLNEYEATRYRIYQDVMETVAKCKNLDELQKQLQQKQIDMQLKYSSQQKQLQGISFKMGEYSFKGSSIDRDLSAKKLEEKLKQNQERTLKLEQEEERNLKQEYEREYRRGQRMSM
jgi:HD-like signal output (HDOD) protein